MKTSVRVGWGFFVMVRHDSQRPMEIPLGKKSRKDRCFFVKSSQEEKVHLLWLKNIKDDIIKTFLKEGKREEME